MLRQVFIRPSYDLLYICGVPVATPDFDKGDLPLRITALTFGLIVMTAAVAGCSDEESGETSVAGLGTERITVNDYGDVSSRIVVDSGGIAHIVWTSLVADEEHIEYVNNSDGTWNGDRLSSATGGVGSYDFDVDASGVAHVIWADEAIMYRHNAGGSFAATEVISSSTDSNWDPSIAAAPVDSRCSSSGCETSSPARARSATT